jgi:hypothetical protein
MSFTTRNLLFIYRSARWFHSQCQRLIVNWKWFLKLFVRIAPRWCLTLVSSQDRFCFLWGILSFRCTGVCSRICACMCGWGWMCDTQNWNGEHKGRHSLISPSLSVRKATGLCISSCKMKNSRTFRFLKRFNRSSTWGLTAVQPRFPRSD